MGCYIDPTAILAPWCTNEHLAIVQHREEATRRLRQMLCQVNLTRVVVYMAVNQVESNLSMSMVDSCRSDQLWMCHHSIPEAHESIYPAVSVVSLLYTLSKA